MSLKKNLHRWEKAGLMHAHQAEDILAYEKERHGGVFMRGLYGLGAFAILIGILTVVAANWQAIPPFIKIAVHLIINAGVAYKMYTFDRNGMKLHRELAVFALMGLTLTLIGLTGQVFHLNGTLGGALILWATICTPFAVVYGRSHISLIPWLAGFLAAIYFGVLDMIEAYVSNETAFILYAALTTALPVVLMHSALAARFISRFALKDLLQTAAIVIALLMTSISTLVWYVGMSTPYFYISIDANTYLNVMVTYGLAAVFVFYLRFNDADRQSGHADFIRHLFLSGIAVSALGYALLEVESQFMAAASFIGYWLYIGHLGQKFGEKGLITAAILMIAIRIYIVFLEVFGSLLLTGFGLIFSGLLLIGMARGVMLLNKNIGTLKTGGDDDE